MRKSWMVLLFVVMPVQAGTVFTYVAQEEPETVILEMEVEGGKVRWQWIHNPGEWYVFDAADRSVTGYRSDEDERLYDIYREEPVEESTAPKLLGKARRAKQECAMYALEVYGATEKVCLVAATKLGVPAGDAATLQTLAEVLHVMQDAGTYSDGLPLVFTGQDAIGIWRSNGTVLAKTEQRAIPAARFATPAGYRLYVPPVIDGK